MSTPRPGHDPAELAALDLTEEEADGLRHGLEQIDRGETVDGATSTQALVSKLAELTRIRGRRSA